ncbi:MAG: hypothetical protein FJ304_05745 [Planctomycetes bacterium]|nr:hypothetical protein [Planctomycetota bacterium]
MLRRVPFALAGLVLAALITPTRAADDLSGNWQLVTSTAAADSTVCVVKVETKDGKPTASVAFAPENVQAKVTDFRVTDTRVVLTVKQTRTVGKQTLTSEIAFVGVRGTDAKLVAGSIGTDTARTRAKLVATTKDALEKDELVTRHPLVEPMAKAAQFNTKVLLAQNKVQLEKDATKRAELIKDLTAARKEADEKVPGLYREVVEKHPHFPAAYDAAVGLLRNATVLKMTAEEAQSLVKVAQKHADPYGPVFGGVALAPVADELVRAGLEAAALVAVEPSAKKLSPDDPAGARVTVLTAYQNALAKAGKADAAKAVSAELAKLESVLDADYLKAVPPFKPTAFAGRKTNGANTVAVLELFTGAQCPPCVAADVAFDGLLKAYKPSELVLIQYHVHIPGPDPLTNPDTVARGRYYGITSAPSSFFNGTRAASGGGAMGASEAKFKQYAEVIDPILEKTTDVKVSGKVARAGDKLDIGLEVTGADGEDLKLRVLVVEENVRYVGSNRVRFHHHVVRAMPGGADGVAVKDKTFKHAASADLGDVRKALTKYLDDYAATRPFPKADRPMEMKDLKVIALVQNDKTKEIVQAAQFDVPAGR